MSSDGLELMMNCLWKLTIISLPVLQVHFYIFVHEGASYGKAWQTENIFLNFIGSALISVEFAIVWTAALVAIVLIVTYANMISKWLEALNW